MRDLRAVLTDETMRHVLVIKPAPADFASYADAVRERLIAALRENHLREGHEHGPLHWEKRDPDGTEAWRCVVCGAFPVLIDS